MRAHRARTKILLEPALQLKLPLILLAVTLVYSAFQIWHSNYAFSALFADVVTEAGEPVFLMNVIAKQSQTFFELAAAVAIAHLLVVGVLSASYAHRMIGPVVAFRRHIEALKNGDYGSRVRLRKGDAFRDMSDDLNELAELLQRENKQREPSNLR